MPYTVYKTYKNHINCHQTTTSFQRQIALTKRTFLFPVHRGENIKEQIVIGTPGTTLDWALKWKVLDLCKIAVCVLDKADVMIATQGYENQTIRIQK